MKRTTMLFRGAWLLVSAVAASCGGGGNGGGGTPVKKTPGQELCDAIKSYVTSCGSGSPCDDALVADCAKLVDVLNESLIIGTRDCLKTGGAPFECLTSSFSSLTPSAGQQAFVASFCNDCPPVAIPGCENAILGGGSVPDNLAVAKTLILPFSDDVLNEIQTECVSGLTCLAEFPSCAQGVLAKRAIPTNTLDCMTNALLNGGVTGDGGTGKTCTPDGGGGTGGGTGGSAGSGTGGGGTGGGGTGGSAGGGGNTASCTGHCGEDQPQQPGNCYCDAACKSNGDCCGDFASVCSASCTDPGPEPNDTPATATQGGNVSCFPIGTSTKSGVLSGTADVDFFAYQGSDSCGSSGGGSTKPWLKADNISPGTTVCLAAKCATTSAPAVSTCLSGVDQGVSPFTCCADGGDIVMQLACSSGASTATDFSVALFQAANVCTPYAFTFTHQP